MKTRESAARGQTIATDSGGSRDSTPINQKEAQMGRPMKDKGLSDTLDASSNYNDKVKKGNVPK